MIRVAVLMTCHNRKEKTFTCLKALFEQQGMNQEYIIQVYLLDDSSTDGTSSIVIKSFPMVKIIEGNGHLYWNRGMFISWKTAALENHDFYLWLNDDTELYDNALQTMLFAAEKTNSKAIICGCIESPYNKEELTYGGGKFVGKKYVMNYPNRNLDPCDIINGNCVLIPHFVFNIVGNLDWKFTHAIGDHDYSLRAKKLGINSYTTGTFVATCAKNETLPKWCLPKTNIKERIKNLYSPLSYNPPDEYFIYEKRHFGLSIALKHYLFMHFRVLVPILWK